ncbi:hypothetical protein ACIP79_41780 [Streptomyces sp. NPDC088747]|uniref:hypothetical protein n=1 Tax=Streptomyces sp. NPDC088747 TaxID=3365886 RepID=UPI0038159C9C
MTLKDAEPTEDDLLPDPALEEAIAGAILNHPHFVVATPEPDGPREDISTVQTRGGQRYLLVLDYDHVVEPRGSRGSAPGPDWAGTRDGERGRRSRR